MDGPYTFSRCNRSQRLCNASSERNESGQTLSLQKRTPSASRNARFARGPPNAYPPSLPSACTTRWHGTLGMPGLSASQRPITRGCTPSTRASCAYETTLPGGMRAISLYASRRVGLAPEALLIALTTRVHTGRRNVCDRVKPAEEADVNTPVITLLSILARYSCFYSYHFIILMGLRGEDERVERMPRDRA